MTDLFNVGFFVETGDNFSFGSFVLFLFNTTLGWLGEKKNLGERQISWFYNILIIT
jgi:hypothetical protein